LTVIARALALLAVRVMFRPVGSVTRSAAALHSPSEVIGEEHVPLVTMVS